MLRHVAPQMSCVGCQLLIDGVLVIDIFEPLLSALSALSSITKASPCITLTSGVVRLWVAKPLLTGIVAERHFRLYRTFAMLALTLQYASLAGASSAVELCSAQWVRCITNTKLRELHNPGHPCYLCVAQRNDCQPYAMTIIRRRIHQS